MPIFEITKSLGLFWVHEYVADDGEPILHGPFMDAPDAKEQCGDPENWRVMYS
jgi:hypothetical protein